MISDELPRKIKYHLYDYLEESCLSITKNKDIDNLIVDEQLKLYLVKNIENCLGTKFEIGSNYILATNREEEEISFLIGVMEKFLKVNNYDAGTWNFDALIDVYPDAPQSAWAFHPDALEPVQYDASKEYVREVSATEAWHILAQYPGEIKFGVKYGMASISVPAQTLGLLFTYINMCRKD
jgi:hypothetical protein